MGGEVKSMRAIVLALSAVLVVAACGKAAATPVPAGGQYRLYEAAATRSDTVVAVINSRSHAVERRLPLGVTSPDWRHLYMAIGSRLIDIDPSSGATLHTMRLPGDYHLPFTTMNGLPGGLSQDGRWLVVQTFDDTPEGPPKASHLLVIDTSYARSPVRIDLPGAFVFDAVSNDGKRVFLIEILSSAIYRVRLYDVGVGLNPNVVFDKTDGTEAMTGQRVSGVPSPDGQWLFSLYVREHDSPFIHALNLDNGFALCLDLPGSGYATDRDAFGWSLAISADGTHLFAANGVLGKVSEISNPSNGAPSLVRTAKLGTTTASTNWFIKDVEAKEIGWGATLLSPDGRTLVTTGASGIVWIDTATLQSRRSELSTWRVTGLALSPDGNTLYAVSEGGMIGELSMDGGTAATFAGAPGGLALLRVEPVVQSP
jgi:WD40 repeat protein